MEVKAKNCLAPNRWRPSLVICNKEMSNVQKIDKISNIEEVNFNTLLTTWWISMKFSEKI